MRLYSTRLFWITLISVFTLLSSSFVSSAPLMTMHMLTKATHNHQAEMSADCAVLEHSSLTHNVELNHTSVTKSVNTKMSEGACSSHACVSIVAVLALPSHDFPVSFQLALIPVESTPSTLHRKQSLYRPPIV